MAKLRVDKIAAPIIKDEFTESVFFDGNGDYLSLANNSDFSFDGDFTIEAFVYPTAFNSFNTIFSTEDIDFKFISSGAVRIFTSSGSNTTGTISLNRWSHIAVVRQGSTFKVYINGNGETVTPPAFTGDGSSAAEIGRKIRNTSEELTGYISNLRVCKGHAVYTENFTVPTRELEVHTKPPKGVVFPAADNVTVLLACQDAYNPLTDATGRHTITGAGNLGGVGQNLVTNGDFSNGTTGWTASDSAAVISNQSGELRIENGDSTAAGANTSFSVVSGRTYVLSFTSTQQTASGTGVRFGFGNAANSFSEGYQTDELHGNHTRQITPDFTGTLYVLIKTRSLVNGQYIHIDNVSVSVVHPVTETNPGLLRKTNITSTITETTGSVYFDGTGDYLEIANNEDFQFGTGDWSIEFWWNGKPTGTYTAIISTLVISNESGTWRVGTRFQNNNQLYFARGTGNGFTDVRFNVDVNDSLWHHIAFVRSNGVIIPFVDGIDRTSDLASGSVFDSNTMTTTNNVRIGYNQRDNAYINGYISNLRICKGHAVYISNFTPPTRELEVHPGPEDDRTVLLCCYDGENIFADKSGRHIIAAYGDRTSSPTPTATDSPIGSTTVTPGLTREVDPTAGPVFQGGAGYNSQNWLTLPKGTTTERFPDFGAVDAASARGVFGGGESPQHTLDYITISTTGDSQTFGDMSLSRYSQGGGVSSNTRGCWGGGQVPSPSFTFYNTIDYITIASTGDSQDFGDLSTTSYDVTGTSNSTRGLFSYGTSGPGFTLVGNIEFITIQSTGNALDFGNLSVSRVQMGGASSTTRGLFAGGLTPGRVNVIDYVSHPTTGNAVDFGNLNLDINGLAGCSSPTRAIFGGGLSPAVRNEIDFVTIATLGNASDFGDLTVARRNSGAVSSSVRGVFGGGSDPSNVDTIDYVTIASAGNATDFGDLGRGASRVYGACSNGHGGLG